MMSIKTAHSPPEQHTRNKRTYQYYKLIVKVSYIQVYYRATMAKHKEIICDVMKLKYKGYVHAS